MINTNSMQIAGGCTIIANNINLLNEAVSKVIFFRKLNTDNADFY